MVSNKMLEAIVHPLPGLATEIRESPIPVPGPDEVVIKVAVAGSNVKGESNYLNSINTTDFKDWLHITARNLSVNSGDDIAGTIHQMGDNVRSTGEYHVGDRVAAFHPMLSPGGAYAEYALAPQHTVFKIPEKTTFEGMFQCLTKPRHNTLTRHRGCDYTTCHNDGSFVSLPTSAPPGALVSTKFV